MSKLFIVPTPIGNLEDITLRALSVLKQVDAILAEDSRKTRILLMHFQIDKKIYPYHKFNEHKQIANFVRRLKAGESLALVSDAGTPAISDPGFLLVRHCIDNQVDIECLPGATAFVPALVLSGLPAEKFVFEGFLPHKKGRNKRLVQLADETRSMIFYESPHRLKKALQQFSDFFGETRRASVSRELSKIYEETQRGTLSELIAHFEPQNIKGEIVIVVEGKSTKKHKNEA